MPLTEKGQEILANMKREYGEEKGEQVFYASANKGTITGVHGDSALGHLPSSVTASEVQQQGEKYWDKWR